MNDPFNLQRYVEAQSLIYDHVCAELRNGRKTTHWMWFVFPQIHGLGVSPTSRHFAIASAKEAEAYLKHPVLGARLLECCQFLLETKGRSAHDIFGSPDDRKLHSSMTLFAGVAGPASIYKDVLRKYFDGVADQATLQKLQTEVIPD